MHAAHLRLLGSAALLAVVAVVAPAVSQSTPADGPAEVTAGLRDSEFAPAVSAGPMSRSVVPDSVIRHPNPSAPLADRWAWARANGPQEGYWVAWGAPYPAAVDDWMVSSNSPWGEAPTRNAPPLREILAGSGAESPPLAFVFGFGGRGGAGEIEVIRIRGADVPLDLEGRPLLWLGSAETDESVDQLRRLHAHLKDPRLRKETAAALTLHPLTDEVLGAVLDVARGDESPEVRAEAVQWLPRVHPRSGEAVVGALLEIAFDDPEEEVRMEAVDALANLSSGSAWRALARIAETHPEWSVRSEAAQYLAGRQ